MAAAAAVTKLSAGTLHRSASSRQVAAMTLLNEIVDEFPSGISFAAGAPYEPFFDAFDPGRLIERYAEELRDRGLEPAAIRRRLYQYGPSRGIINDLVAEALWRDEGIDVAPEALVMTVGAQEALFLSLRVLHPASSSLAVPDPCYVGVLAAADTLDIPVVPIPDDGRGPDPDRLRAAYHDEQRAGRRLRALYVAPDFANPSGSRMERTTRERLLAVAAELGLILIEDNPYGFTASACDRIPSLKALDRNASVLRVGTFAKVGVPGARVGYALADQIVTDGERCGLLADYLSAAKNAVTLNTSPVAQAMVAGLLLEHGVSIENLGRQKADRLRSNLRLLLNELRDRLGPPVGVDGVPSARCRWFEPAGGYFVQVELPVPVDGELLRRSAREHGVLWAPMHGFYLGKGGERRLRLSCSALEPDEILEGVQRFAGFVNHLDRP